MRRKDMYKQKAEFFDTQVTASWAGDDYTVQEKERLNELSLMTGSLEKKNILEPGCGTGRLTEILAKKVGPKGQVLALEYQCQHGGHCTTAFKFAYLVNPATLSLLFPTGTGKELMARAIHNLSQRKGGPFVAINCGALPDTLLESELFGYVAGAFTDAKKDKAGRFDLARGGPLFLDEIGDVSPALQVRLLRVFQEKIYELVGAVNSVETHSSRKKI